MSFLTKEKTNWKYILIVAILALIVGGGILVYLRYFNKEISSLAKFPEIKKPKKIEEIYSEEKLPRFEDFPVYEKFEGPPAPPDFSSNPDAMRFITEITEGAKKGPNFAGHYTIVEWGCGTECQAGVIVDAQTGRIYSNLPLSAFGRKFQVSSNLLIINPPEKIKSFYPYYPYDEEGKLPDWLYSEYYKWENNQFVLVYKFKPEIKISDWKTYRNEEYGFEIKYPPTFAYHNLSAEEGGFRIGFWDKDCLSECGLIEISIKQRNNKTFEEIKKEVEKKYTLLYSRPATFQETIISGERAFIYPSYETNLGGVTTIKGEYIYSISRSIPYSASPQEIKGLELIFPQMLSTFKFLE